MKFEQDFVPWLQMPTYKKPGLSCYATVWKVNMSMQGWECYHFPSWNRRNYSQRSEWSWWQRENQNHRFTYSFFFYYDFYILASVPLIQSLSMAKIWWSTRWKRHKSQWNCEGRDIKVSLTLLKHILNSGSQLLRQRHSKDHSILMTLGCIS